MNKKMGEGTFFSCGLQKWSDEVWFCLFYKSHKNCLKIYVPNMLCATRRPQAGRVPVIFGGLWFLAGNQ